MQGVGTARDPDDYLRPTDRTFLVIGSKPRTKGFDQAEAMWVDMLARAKRVWGDEHPETQGAMNNIATLHYHLKKYQQAADMFAESSGVLRRTLDLGHWKIGVCLSNQGACLLTLRRFEQAAEVLIEAYGILSEWI